MAVNMVKTLFGTGVLVLSAVICYQYFRILKNVYRHEDFALTLLFLDDRGPRAFQLLAGVGAAYAGGGLIVAIGTMHNWSLGVLFDSFGRIVTTSDVLFSFVPKVATLIAMVGVIYFQQLIFKILTPPSKRDGADDL